MTRRLLFEPIRLGTVTLRNRIVFPPMTTGYELQGKVTARSRHFYRTVANGGVGLIVLGDVSVQPSFAPTPWLYDDSFVPGLRELVDEVHAEGACIAAQLFHQEYDVAAIGRLMQGAGREAAMHQLHGDRLVGMFSSPLLNRRSDAYGGSDDGPGTLAGAIHGGFQAGMRV